MRDNNSGTPIGSSGDGAVARPALGGPVNRPRPLVLDPLLLTLCHCDTSASRDTTNPMLEEFATSSLSLVATPAAAWLEDEPPTEVSYTCGLLGRQQTPSQHADSVLQTPPPCPTLRVEDSSPLSSQQEYTHASASLGTKRTPHQASVRSAPR